MQPRLRRGSGSKDQAVKVLEKPLSEKSAKYYCLFQT